MKQLALTAMLVAFFAVPAIAAQPDCSKSNRPERPYSPYVGKDYPKDVYWGDTHVHTSFSYDAGVVLETGPEEAYRFARGEEVMSPYSGQPAKLVRPLDFLVVADHAEYLGISPMLRANQPEVMKLDIGKRWGAMLARKTFKDAYGVFLEMRASMDKPEELIREPAIKRSAWQQIIDAAEKYNEPGKFTSFIGFEWTSKPGGNNLHRVVVFKDDGERAKQVLPYSIFDSQNPEDLWAYMADYEDQSKGDVLAIPHNGNLSNGMMFSDKDFNGAPLSRAYARSRMRWEPLVEVTQIKGDGETHPFLSTDDEFADYETWDKANITATVPKEDWMLKYEYARSALRTGLELEEKIGANPFKFGMIGSTDTHTGLATAREENFFGKHPGVEPMPCRSVYPIFKSKVDPKMSTQGRDMTSSGYAAVWATENTRKALFDAMERREVYATTGPRMTVRLFGGWDYAEGDADSAFFADIGYGSGVPMGGDLTAAPEGKAPTFLIRATKDPDGANLDRVQVVKGWLDADGASHEKVYDVALSDGRREVDGVVPPVGNTVDVADATYTNSIGDAELATRWMDPDFDPGQRAFYYARVIEIPTPRWPAYDTKYFENTMPEGTEMVTQERAYTSPIWYTP